MSVTALTLRPTMLPGQVTDEDFLLAVRAYLLGEHWQSLQTLLQVDNKGLRDLMCTPQWRAAQTAFRDEYVDKVQGRLTRIESTILDGVEDALANGITAHNMMGDAYHRNLTVNEKMKIWQLLQDSQKALTKFQQNQQPTPQAFSRSKKMEDLAKFAAARTIEAEPTVASGD